MGSVRISDTTGALFMDFRLEGRRCREYTALSDTPTNRKKLERVLARIESEIASAILSGCPSVTDSEVKVQLLTSCSCSLPAEPALCG